MPVVEFFSCHVSDAYRADPKIFKAPAKILHKADGLLGAWYGLQVEDQKTMYLIVLWETLHHHQKLMAHESYPQLIAGIKAASSGGQEMRHIEVNTDSDAIKTFESGVVEVTNASLKPGASKEHFSAALPDLQKAVRSSGIETQAVSGPTLEDGDKFVVAVGWESIEAHNKAFTFEEPRAILGKYRELVKLESRHVVLEKYEP